MIVIYTQDKTYIRNNAAAARSILLDIYGEKLGEEAYHAVNKARIGTAFRKNGAVLEQHSVKMGDRLSGS